MPTKTQILYEQKKSPSWECTFKVVVFISFLDILHEIKLLPSNEIIEVQRSELVSNFTEDTEKKTKKKIKQSFGKRLFVEKAYTLTSKSDRKKIGK